MKRKRGPISKERVLDSLREDYRRIADMMKESRRKRRAFWGVLIFSMFWLVPGFLAAQPSFLETRVILLTFILIGTLGSAILSLASLVVLPRAKKKFKRLRKRYFLLRAMVFFFLAPAIASLMTLLYLDYAHFNVHTIAIQYFLTLVFFSLTYAAYKGETPEKPPTLLQGSLVVCFWIVSSILVVYLISDLYDYYDAYDYIQITVAELLSIVGAAWMLSCALVALGVLFSYASFLQQELNTIEECETLVLENRKAPKKALSVLKKSRKRRKRLTERL
jgi:MFS family permease